ncbi:hypothetical protein ACQV5M_20130, partial [Leptospira sp. SA-E8]|uniref:hypothetical protein n=1 Tax=Leptospira sp. SA-E8 TaxID=3422259 RepID=UPI003EBE28B7
MKSTGMCALAFREEKSKPGIPDGLEVVPGAIMVFNCYIAPQHNQKRQPGAGVVTMLYQLYEAQ